MRERSWLGDMRRRHGWTQQPAKYVSGFLYGLAIAVVVCAAAAGICLLLSGNVVPIAFWIFLCVFFAALIGLSE